MSPRRLNSVINVLKPHERRDQDTGAEITTYDRYHRGLPAYREDVSGGVTRRGTQVEANVSAIFTIRFLRDMETNYRIEIPSASGGGQESQYDIVSILDRDGHSRWLEIHCSKTA